MLNFAHIVSHNLRTHSGNIKSLLDLHKEALLSESDALNNIQIVSDELFSTIESLNDLVSVYTERENNMQLLKINSLIDKVLDVLYESIKQKGIQVLNYVESPTGTAQIMPTDLYLDYVVGDLGFKFKRL